jgi:site-specific DNA-adenine methylase
MTRRPVLRWHGGKWNLVEVLWINRAHNQNLLGEAA